MADETFDLPDLGEGLPDAEIVEWHVQEGDTVEEDQALLSVETEKAVVEVPSPRAGRVAKLHAKAGDIVEVGQPLVDFEDSEQKDEGEGGGEQAGEREEKGEPEGGKRKDAGTVVGAVEEGDEQVDESASTVGETRVGVRATPAVRALAKRHDVDLSLVSPSGRDGTITADDVKRAARTLEEVGQLEPLRGARRTMARHMAMAHKEIAAVTLNDDADIHDWSEGTDVTIRLLRAIVAGARTEPSLNAWYDSHEVGRRVIEKVDVAIAVDTEDGLFVPVLRDVANRDADDLRKGLERMKDDVKARKVPPEEMRGYTITLSNFGTFAGRYASPIVQPPSVAILGAGRSRPRWSPYHDKPKVRRILPLSLTFDHRAVTGGEAARFLAAAIADLEGAD